jgi:hypothetical protein
MTEDATPVCTCRHDSGAASACRIHGRAEDAKTPMTEHANTCDLVGVRQGYNAPAVCSCGFDQQCAHGNPKGACSWCDLRDDGGLPEAQGKAEDDDATLGDGEWIRRQPNTYICWNCKEQAIYGKPHACDTQPPDQETLK